MSKESKHTQGKLEVIKSTAWNGTDCLDIVISGEVIAKELDRANADRIVIAVNNHHELLEALKESASMLDFELDYTSTISSKAIKEVYELITQAINKAEGGV